VSPTDERIDRLERQVEKLLATIKAQAAEIVELKGRLGENSSNSSKPPSSDSPANRHARPKDAPRGNPRGGQRGHKAQADVSAGESGAVVDGLLPPAVPAVRRRAAEAARRRSGSTSGRRHPEDRAGRRRLLAAPRDVFVRGDHVRHASHRRPAGDARRAGAGVDRGADRGWAHESPQGTEPARGGLRPRGLARHIERVRADRQRRCGTGGRRGANPRAAVNKRVKYVDATTWYQAGAYRSLWTLATASVTVFAIVADGTRETLRLWIDRIRGVLVTDRGSQFGFWAMERRQICWAHLMRKFAAFSELPGRPGEIGANLLLWSQVLLHSWHRVRDGTGTRADLKLVATNLHALIEQLLDEGAALPIKGFQGACRNILEHREALWRFVFELGVDPTNNHAERELRGLVCWRRSTGGSRSDRGDLFAANLKSVIHTCRKQRRHVLTYLNSAIHAALRGRKTPSLIATT